MKETIDINDTGAAFRGIESKGMATIAVKGYQMSITLDERL